LRKSQASIEQNRDLLKNQWQLKTASQEDYLRLVEEKFRPIKHQLEQEVVAAQWFEPKAVYGYFPAERRQGWDRL
jgi:cobalamin-dependent methionine synthase I